MEIFYNMYIFIGFSYVKILLMVILLERMLWDWMFWELLNEENNKIYDLLLGKIVFLKYVYIIL